MIKKLVLFLVFTASIFGQYDPDYWYYYANQGRNQVKYGNFNGSVYAYRTYSASDTLLNTHSSEFTVLPQSTMKVNFQNIRQVNTFSSATDTTDNSYGFYSRNNATTEIVGGKLRVTINAIASGIRSIYTYQAGTILHVKFKARLVSGTPAVVRVYDGYNIGAQGAQYTFTSEERIYENTVYFSASEHLNIYGNSGTNGQVYEFDDIEVREISNLVSNGTFASDVSWVKETGLSITGGVGVFTSSPTGQGFRQAISLASGKRYIATYQITTITEGSLRAIIGSSLGTPRTATGVYSDTLISSGGTNISIQTTGASTSATIDNIHVYEIPAYYSNALSNTKVGYTKVDYMVGAGDSTALKMISTASGDSVYNNIKIASGTNTFRSFEKDKKYTVEAWVRGTGVRGIPTYTSNFGSGVDGFTTVSGTVVGGQVISDGTIIFDSVLAYSGNGLTTPNYFTKTLGQNATNIYRLSFWYLVPASNDTVDYIQLSNSLPIPLNGESLNLTAKGSWTYYTALLKFPNTNATRFQAKSTTSPGIALTDSFYIANLQLVPISQPTITMQVQGQTKLSDTLSIIPTVFEKVVWNFQANATYGIDTLKFWTNQADTVYIDSVNIKQFYPTTICGWFKTGVTGTLKSIISKSTGTTSTISFGYWLYIETNNKLIFSLFDAGGATSLAATSQTYTDDKWHLFTATVDVNACSLMVDNEVVAISNVKGNSNNSSPYTIGRLSYTVNGFFNGQLGEIMQIRNYAASQADHLANYQRGLQGLGIQIPSTGTVAFYQNWAGNNLTEVAKDKSGNGYDLTLSGLSFTDIFAIEGYK